MRLPRFRCDLLSFAALGMIAGACHDPISSPDNDGGSIRLSVTTQGSEFADSHEYTISIEGEETVTVGSDAVVEVHGVQTGVRLVRLGALPVNCSAGVQTRAVNVRRGQVITAAFSIVCARWLGYMKVVAATTGADRDLDGYRVLVNGIDYGEIYPNGESTIIPMAKGDQRVSLDDVADNCAGGAEVVRQFQFQQQTQIDFEVNCELANASLRVSVATTGAELPMGYTVNIHGLTREVAVDGSTVISGLAADDVRVRLYLPVNCAAAAGPVQTASLRRGIETEIQFAVHCVALSSAIRITVATTGADIDPDGFRILLDDSVYGGYSIFADVGANGSVLLDRFMPGSTHSVSIVGVAPNCVLTSAPILSVQLVANTVSQINFNVSCSQGGVLEGTVATGGASIDADGYTLSVVGLPLSTPAAPNGVARIAAIPAGNRQVALSGVAPNCTVAGGATRSATFTAGQLTSVAFNVACTATPTVSAVIAATGAPPDPDGYVLEIYGQGAYIKARANSASPHAFTGLPVTGEYEVRISDVAANCSVNPPGGSLRLYATGGQTATANFDVSCEAARSVVYAAEVGGNWDIYTNNTNGSGLNRLTTASSEDKEPAWSSQGRIAFTSNRTGNFEIHVMDGEGSNEVQLTLSPGADESPSWSADGGRIVFVSDRDGDADIYLMNADGSGLTRLTNNTVRDADPAWSPDGTRIAFTRQVGAVDQIFVMNADGTGEQRVSSTLTNETHPSWSPDGTQLAFAGIVCDFYYCDSQIFLVRPDGTLRVLLSHSFGIEPAWSPDGTVIIYQAPGCTPGGCHSIETVQLQSGSRGVVVYGNVASPDWRR